MPKQYQKKKQFKYEPSEEEVTAYNWGVENGYIISPMGINSMADAYRIGISTVSNYKNVKKDPNIYEHDEVMQKVYEYYKYYYNKRK